MSLAHPPYIDADPNSMPDSAVGRFYPACVPPFAHEPLPKDFRIDVLGDDFGRGLMALRPFQPSEVVFTFTGFFSAQITLHTLTVGPDQHVHDPYVMGRVLHACDPNMTCDMRTFTFSALRTIVPGDLCTMDYGETEAQLFRGFQCGCGSSRCRGWIGPRP